MYNEKKPLNAQAEAKEGENKKDQPQLPNTADVEMKESHDECDDRFVFNTKEDKLGEGTYGVVYKANDR